MNIDELALKVGAKHYSPAPMRAVRGWSFTFEQLQALLTEYEAADQGEALFAVFDGPPDHNAPRFIEVETAGGCSVKVGEWKPYGDYWTLGPLYARPDPRVKELEAEIAQQHSDSLSLIDQIVHLTKKIAELGCQLAEANKERTWVRRKLGIPEDCGFLSGGVTPAGTMHCVCSHANGYLKYIDTEKCDDKAGEIARLSVQLAEARKDAARLDYVDRNKLEISADGDWEEFPTFSVVEVSGGRNDREFRRIGRGDTVREAIDAAMKGSE